MANKIIIIIINKKERKPVAKDKYTTRRERLVGYGRVRGVSRVSESQEIFFRAADNESNPKRILLTGWKSRNWKKSLLRNKKLLRD